MDRSRVVWAMLPRSMIASSDRERGVYRAAPIINAKDPATMAAGILPLTLTAPPVLGVDDGVGVAELVAVIRGVLLARTLDMLELGVGVGVGVGVTDSTRSRVLVIVVVLYAVVVSATASCAAARQRIEDTKVLIFMFASSCFKTRNSGNRVWSSRRWDVQ